MLAKNKIIIIQIMQLVFLCNFRFDEKVNLYTLSMNMILR